MPLKSCFQYGLVQHLVWYRTLALVYLGQYFGFGLCLVYHIEYLHTIDSQYMLRFWFAFFHFHTIQFEFESFIIMKGISG